MTAVGVAGIDLSVKNVKKKNDRVYHKLGR
jgi:hypothetical protein